MMARSVDDEKVVVPSKEDVLCGRGKTCFEHQGNISFRFIVASNMSNYIAATRRKEKTRVARSIIKEVVERGGRFLKKNSCGGWYDAGMKAAKEKVGHALRDASTDRVKCMTRMHKDLTKKQRPRRISIGSEDSDSGVDHSSSSSRSSDHHNSNDDDEGSFGRSRANTDDTFDRLIDGINLLDDCELSLSDEEEDLGGADEDILAISHDILHGKGTGQILQCEIPTELCFQEQSCNHADMDPKLDLEDSTVGVAEFDFTTPLEQLLQQASHISHSLC